MRCVLFVLSAMAIACGSTQAGPPQPTEAAKASGGGEGGAPEVVIGSSGGASVDLTPGLEGVCGLASGAQPPLCEASVTNRGACDGLVSSCTIEGAGAVRYVCMNLADGRPLGWTRVHAIETPCDGRADACSELGGETAEEVVSRQIQALLDGCLGNESGVTVALADGCATAFVLSSDDPDRVACVAQALESRRFTCAPDVTCSSASLSTLR